MSNTADTRPNYIQITVKPELLRRIDQARRAQANPPTRPELVRAILEQALPEEMTTARPRSIDNRPQE